MERKYHYRRNLPHHQWIKKVFFVTFCTHWREVLTPGSRDIILETCLVGNGKLFQLHAVVVMPDHVHMMLTPLGDEEGEVATHEIMQRSGVYPRIGSTNIMGRKGRLWQEESFDRARREVENVRGKIEYILANPVCAGLVSSPFDYRWLWTESTGGDARASTISVGVTD
jgi:REP-associated tyrosine transposase